MIKMSRIFLLIVVIIQSSTLSVADVEQQINTLQTQVLELKEEVNELNKIVEDIEKMVKRNIADQKLDKTIANIILNDQEKATFYWTEVMHFLELSQQNQYLKTLVEQSYLGNSDNFYHVLDFLARNELYTGYEMLLKELENHGETHSSQEIFALAHQVMGDCGVSNDLYEGMPKVVKEVLSGPIILKNVENNGYLMASEESSTDERCNSRQSCYGQARSQVFVYRLNSANITAELQTNVRAHWQFVGSSNITELSEGFYMKNRDQDLFFVVKQRVSSAFLRDNTTFDSYYAKDMNAQFLPTLIPNASPEGSLFKIGIREKHVGKIEHFYSGEFKKVNRLDFGRRAIFRDEVNGFVWEAIPVQGENDANLKNAIQVGDNNDRCKRSM